jgi:bla regulator protein BlaR1
MNHLFQSTGLVLAVWLLTLAFRRNRASVRFWLWFSASVKFLVPFSLLVSLGSVMPAPRVVAPAIAVVQVVEPFTAVPIAIAPRHIDWLPIVWACGFALVVGVRFRGWLRVRAALQASAPTDIPSVHVSAWLLEPGVVGWWRPTLLLPAGIFERLTPRQLQAVLAHEFCHVRRRDNLLASIQMAVEAIFWFHPLVWWIGARLVEERERACDEEVLRSGNAPDDYADAILNVCKLYVESPLPCVAGVTGADLKKRIESILAGRVAFRLSGPKRVALALVAGTAVAIPLLLGMQTAVARPKFEVASVKPCTVDPPGTGGGGRKAGSPTPRSPERLSTACMSVEDLIRDAYVMFAKGDLYRDPSNPPLSGVPDWTRTARYIIDAKAEGAHTQGMMMGPMLQTLLEDRFHVKVHHETREVPVYFLSVAKDGPKLTPFQKGSCTPVEFGTVPAQRPVDMCHVMVGRGTLTAQASTVTTMSKLLPLILDRPVIDKTGITGTYDFFLKFALDERTPYPTPDGMAPGPPPVTAVDEPGPTIFEALQKQYGLKLDPGKGPREFVVIDHVERPSEN